jgi:hypothetical protein
MVRRARHPRHLWTNWPRQRCEAGGLVASRMDPQDRGARPATARRRTSGRTYGGIAIHPLRTAYCKNPQLLLVPRPEDTMTVSFDPLAHAGQQAGRASFIGGCRSSNWRSCDAIKVLERVVPVVLSTSEDLVPIPGPRPMHAASTDPVMATAREVMTSNGRSERDRLSVKGNTPLRRTEWRDNSTATAAEAKVDSRCVLHADIQNSFTQLSRHQLDKLVSDRLGTAH